MGAPFLHSPLLGTAVPLHGQLDMGRASRPPEVQSPERREHGAGQKAPGFLPQLWGDVPSPGRMSQTQVTNRSVNRDRGAHTRDHKGLGLGQAFLERGPPFAASQTTCGQRPVCWSLSKPLQTDPSVEYNKNNGGTK